MPHRRERPSPPLGPDALEPPDIGFTVATGVYLAAVLVATSVTVAFAIDASAPTIVGSLSTGVTVGLVAGALLASRIDGLPERLALRTRRLALPFAAPVAFAVIALAAYSFSSLPQSTGIGALVGVVGTGIAAVVLASMARTRYARTVAGETPRATIPWVNPNRGRRWIAAGVLFLGVAGVTVLVGESGLAYPAWWIVYGVLALAVGLAFQFGSGTDDEGPRSLSLLPDRARRRLFGSNWLQETIDDGHWYPKLLIHDAGLVVKRPLQRRFVPWDAVAAVRLTADELVFERPRRLDLRCDRSVIEDADRTYAEIERLRAKEGDRG